MANDKMYMNFIWKDYCELYQEKVELLFDDDAIRFTGCDEGFKAFFDYWWEELGAESFFCKVIFHNECLMGVVALAKSDDEVFTIQEIAISSEYRGRGYGTLLLKELLTSSSRIIGQDIHIAEAVIFPQNIASQRAFSKAGFNYSRTHPDGDALYYQYTSTY